MHIFPESVCSPQYRFSTAICAADAVATTPSFLSHFGAFLYSERIELTKHGLGMHLPEPPGDWEPQISVKWFAPFFSSGGYSSEALAFVSYLKDKIQLGISRE